MKRRMMICVLLCGILVISMLSSYGYSITCKDEVSDQCQTKYLGCQVNSNKTDLSNPNSRNVLIELDLNGIVYGHELLWKANTTGTNYEESSVAYIDGISYIGSCSTHGDGHDKLFAVDTTDGEILWSNPIGPGYVGPVIDNDRIYIGTSSHGYDPTNEYIYAINRYNGSIIWQRNIFGGIPESIQFDDDKIYFTSDKIYALYKDDGAISWTYQMDSFSVTKPILKDNAFYTASSGGRLYKVDAIDGSRIWSISLSGDPWDNSITADGEGHIFLAIYSDKTINSYNEKDGSLIWSYLLHGSSLSFNAYHNNVVFIADTSGYVYALNSTYGTLIWEKKIGNRFDISSPTLSNELLFIGTRDGDEGSFYVLNETSGDIIWKYKIGSSITAPPSVADGMMLCGTDDWHMYAFDFGVGSGNWILNRYDSNNTAYSPDGLTSWQYVSATCTTYINVTTCTVTNNYDHDVTNIELKLIDNFNANWYDSSGKLLKSESYSYIIESLSSSSSLVFIITKEQVQHPNKPATPSGPISGRPGRVYTYTTNSTDPEEDQVYYWFDWGDGSDSGWLGPYESGDTCEAKHTWSEQGSYQIKVKAKDIYDYESEWSDPLVVSMPRNKQYINTPFLQFLQNFLQNYPHMFLILRYILGLQ